MLFNNALTTIKEGVAKLSFDMKTYSPEIKIYAGVGGLIIAGVMACVETLRAKKIIDSKEDSKIKKVGKVGLTYLPSVSVAAASVLVIANGNNEWSDRCSSLAASCATFSEMYKNYRKKESEEDPDKDIEIRDKVAEENVYMDYGFWFEEGVDGWTGDPEYDLMYLRMKQSYANDILKTKEDHILVANEIYDMFGRKKKKSGAFVGWIYDPKDDTRDNFIDFGLQKYIDGKVNHGGRFFVDLNVDGPVIDAGVRKGFIEE